MIRTLFLWILACALLAAPWSAYAVAPAPVAKTGQTTSYATGDDGDLEQGVAWPAPRFTDNSNGTVTDNLTGLIWLQNAQCTDTVGGIANSGAVLLWASAIDWSNALASGSCGLTDGSLAGDWLLPNVEQLGSLVDFSSYNPSLPAEQPFTDVQSGSPYWTSTSYAGDPSYAWYVALVDGVYRNNFTKISTPYHVLPVYGGHGSVALSPADKDFGAVNISATSTEQVFTLSNNNIGTKKLAVSAIAATGGDETMFTVSPGDGSNGTCGATPALAPAASCTISVTFTPASVGAKSTTLRISSNDPITPDKDVPLSGTGQIAYTIGTSVVGGHGTISCDTPVVPGNNSICTISPAAGYRLDTFTDNSVDKRASVTGNNHYTITNVTANHTISGTFAINPIVINDAAAITATTSVNLKLIYADAAKMQFLYNNKSWTAWATFAATKTISLPSGDGLKTVYVRFMDAGGTTSAIYSAAIMLDTIAPTGFVIINSTSGDGITTSPTVTLNLAVVDKTDDIEMQVSNSSNFAGASWEPFAASIPFTLTGDYGTRTVYARFMDTGGKISKVASDTVIYQQASLPAHNTGALSINGAAPFTTATGVVLTVTKPDANDTQMSLSNDGAKWSSWATIPTTNTKSYGLPSGDGIKTVYVKFRTAALTESAIYYAAIILDTKAPVGTISINNGAYATNPALENAGNVTLKLTAADVNGVTHMQVSNDGSTWSVWETFDDTKEITLLPGDGAKKAYVRYRDSAGKVSATYSDSIIVDTLAPTGTVKINGGAATTSTQPVTLTIAGSGTPVAMQFSLDGGGWSDWEPYAKTRTVTLPGGSVELRLKDLAGNISAIIADTIGILP